MQKIIYLEKNDAAELPADAGEEERLESAVRWINTKVQSTVHFGLLQIGYYLLQNFFGGSVEEALSRNPHKDHSFRKLCKRPDLLLSSTHLVSSVKLVAQEKKFASEPAFQKLAVSHKIALLSVPDAEDKRQLARRAVAEKLSVRALTREVRNARQDAEVDDGRVWGRRLRRALGNAVRLAEEPVLDGMSAQEIASLDRAIIDARRRLQTTLAELRGIRSVAV